MKKRKAVLITISVVGAAKVTHEHVVQIAARLERCYRIECIDDKPVKLVGENEYMYPGQQAVVPDFALATIH